MNFKQLNKASQLIIIAELSGAKIQTIGFNQIHIANPSVVSTGLSADLQEHGLSNNALLNPSGGQINLIIESKDVTSPNNVGYGIYPSNNHFNIGRHGNHTLGGNLVMSFGCRLTQEEIDNTGLNDGAISGRLAIAEDDDLRDLLTTVATYITTHTENKEVLQPVLQLIDGYNKALTLPNELIERIANWTSIARLIDNLTNKITHNYSNYYANDEGGDEYQIPVPRGRNVFNVERKFGRSGFTVGYDQHAEEYSGYQLDVEYIPGPSLENGILKVSLNYRSHDDIILSETELLSDMSVDEVISTIVNTLNVVKLNEEWGSIVTPMIDHVSATMVEAKPFIIATLK